jgi:hypothetical protein
MNLTSVSLKIPLPKTNGRGEATQSWNTAQERQAPRIKVAENPLGALPPRSASWARTSSDVLIISKDLFHENTSPRLHAMGRSYPLLPCLLVLGWQTPGEVF